MTAGQIRNSAERPLLAQARTLAEAGGWLHYHPPQCQHARGSEPGFPDLIVVRAPVLIAIEIKRAASDRPTEAQMNWLRSISEVRVAESYVLRPGPDIDDLANLLR